MSRKGAFMPPDGRLRLSQLVSTHGPGAMLDLVDTAVLVSGIDHWRYQSAPTSYEIDLPRLRDRVMRYFRGKSIELQRESPFRTAPPGDERDPSYANGIPVFEFPSWVVCQNNKCRALRRASELDLKSERRRHQCDDGKNRIAVPVRFVVACSAGHLDDFPWRWFVHMGREPGLCTGPAMTLTEGRTGDFAELEVACACGARQKLMTAYDVPIDCTGARPWLGKDAKEPCEQKMRLLIRTASNSYFPQVMSALAIPEGQMELRDKIETVWETAKNIKSQDKVAGAREFNDKFRQALEDYSDIEIWKSIVAIRENKAVEREPLRTAEFKNLTGQKDEQVGELPPPPGVDYFARRVPVEGLPTGVRQVVLAHRLRIVSVLVGFTRLEAPAADLQGEFDLAVKSALVTLNRRWLPATEARGEGIFVQLDSAALEEWEARRAVKERARCLEAGYEAWKRKKAPDAGEFLGVRYYLLHSLSHLLMSAVALECGYSGSSLQERIYCSGPKEPPTMAGILLSTSTPGSEGSLGGLVEQGRVLGRHFARALHMGRLCSNDPVCASHDPETDPTERHREGAACHGCLFVSEPSCERFNQYLDRALVVPTIGNDGLAFFEAIA
jgi:hypothetical protein